MFPEDLEETAAMRNEIQKVKDAVEVQIRQTNEIIASNEAIADAICEMDNTLASGFNVLNSGLQELYFSIDYGLQEICDKLDLQNKTLEAIKEILEKPLDTQAKELRRRGEEAYLNGWIDEAESDLLMAEQKNYQDFIAHHILGNIYFYHKNNYQKALEYYQKAAKYASPQSKKYASNALLCVAMVYYKLGQLPEAYKSTKMAIESPLPKRTSGAAVFSCQNCGYQSPKWLGRCPNCNSWNSFIEGKGSRKITMELPFEDSRVLYHHARYSAKMGHMDEFIDCLTKSIINDSNYLITADRDEMLSDVKDEISKLAGNLRREKANAVNNIKRKIDLARKEAEALGINDVTSLDNKLAEVDELYSRNTYFDLLKAEQIALNAYKESLSEWIKVKEARLGELKAKESDIKNRSYGGWGCLSAILVLFLTANIIVHIPDLTGPRKIGPTKVFKITYDRSQGALENRLQVFAGDLKLRNYGYYKGETLKVLEETKDAICLLLKNGERECYGREGLFFYGRLETGYYYDYSKILGMPQQTFWILGFPIIIGILSAIILKSNRLDAVRNKIEKENMAIARLKREQEY